ncbi:MAG: hypothetical protein Q8T08_14375 [Ignavibacteria bacterium]|nr:hypothetical protein [Ignavibacteria bacterium]
MTLTTSIIGLSLLAIIFLPFLLMAQKDKRKVQNLINRISGLAEKNNSKLTDYELLNSLAIGIDNENNHLFFIRSTSNKVVEEVIRLSDFQKCRVVNSGNTMNTKINSIFVTDKLYLAFIGKENKQEFDLELYNSDYDGLTLKGELQLAEKWAKIINGKISKIRS